jgi:hypothetical protein
MVKLEAESDELGVDRVLQRSRGMPSASRLRRRVLHRCDNLKGMTGRRSPSNARIYLLGSSKSVETPLTGKMPRGSHDFVPPYTGDLSSGLMSLTIAG